MNNTPASRLFLSVAEEHFKAGKLDQAISVLLEGLKGNPGYSTARVLLGKVYQQKGMLSQAQAEFEAVVRANPENLLAQRRLAMIYGEQGNVAAARKAADVVLMINPRDAEILGLIDRWSSAAARPPSPPAQPPPAPPSFVKEPPGPVPAAEALPSFVEPKASNKQEQDLEEPGEPMPVFELPEAEAPGVEAILPEVQEPQPGSFDNPLCDVPEAGAPAEVSSPSLAEVYVKQGHFEEGIRMYRRLLAKDPQNRDLRQRLEDAETLAKLLTRQVPDPAGSTPIPEVATSPSPLPAASPPVSGREKMIQRLERWLAELKKSQGVPR